MYLEFCPSDISPRSFVAHPSLLFLLVIPRMSSQDLGSLESKLLRASSKKISCLQETVSLLNQCTDKENQGRLETDNELKSFGKNFKK